MKFLLLAVLVLIWQYGRAENVYAVDFDYGEGQEILDKYTKGEYDIGEMVDDVKSGKGGIWDGLLSVIKDNLTKEIAYNRNALVKIILICTGGAILLNFSIAFGNSDISGTGYMITYMMVTAILMSSFGVLVGIAAEAVEAVLDFISALAPAYFLAMGLAGGGVSSVGFYETILVIISVVNRILLKIMIPAVCSYVAIMIINNVTTQDYLSKFGEFIKMLINRTLKALIGIVLGINMVKSLILPSVDMVEGKAAAKLVSMIPGIGGGAESLANILLGSGVLIKNSIGVAIVAGMALICAIPAVKLMVFIIMYRILGAILQPVTDNRLTEATQAAAEGAMLLFRITMYSFVLFALSIAVICMATNFHY